MENEQNTAKDDSRNFALRPYQITALNRVHADLQTEKHVLLQAIMGAGKTVMVCRLINRYFFETDRNFLILAHKEELVKQFHKTFREKTDVPDNEIGIACAGISNKVQIKKRIVIATRDTFINQLSKYQYCSMLVVDECHAISMDKKESRYYQIISDLQSKNEQLRILGTTATPFRMGLGFCYGNRNAGEVLFPRLNHCIKYEELKEKGFLMPLEGLAANTNALQKDIDGVKRNGDFVLEQLQDVMTKQIHLETAVEEIREHCQEFNRICVFCVGIDHAEALKDLLGDECTTVHSKLTPIEREKNMRDWQEGRKRIITSINILVEGFDFPPLDCLVMARHTLSPGLYLQAVGRVIRTHPSKKRAFLLDLTDNTARFGTDLDNIKVKIPKKVSAEALKKFEKECPECNCWMHVARIECPDCGYIYPPTEREIEIATERPDLQSVKFEPEPPMVCDIFDVKFKRHKKKGKPDSMRVEYHDENPYQSLLASEWVCLEHGGFASQKASEWWDKMTTGEDPVPKTVDEALDRIEDEFIYPEKVVLQVDKNGFDKVLDHIFYDEDIERLGLEQGKEPEVIIEPDFIINDDVDDIPF